MIVIPIKYNHIVDALARKGARLDLAHHNRDIYGVKVLCRRYVPNIAKFR